jgi:hypothetical protein
MNPLANQPTEIILDYKTPVLAVDGQIILGKSDGSVDLAFVQFNKPDQPVADVVAALRLRDLDALKALKDAIVEHLTKENAKEK